jgi:hypothetical protein
MGDLSGDASSLRLGVTGSENFAACFAEKTRFRYAVTPDGMDVTPQMNGYVPSGLADVTGLDRPFSLDVIVKADFVDVCIDNRRTLFHQWPDDFARGSRLFFFVRNGAVKFENVTVRPLIK